MPDYWIQGDTLADFVEHLKDLDLASDPVSRSIIAGLTRFFSELLKSLDEV
jgi:hypothetical protein